MFGFDALEDRTVPAPFNFGPHPIDAAYRFPSGGPIPGWTGPVVQAFCDVNGDGFADSCYLAAGPGAGARMLAYDGSPGTSDNPTPGTRILSDSIVLGTDADRFGVSAAEGFDTSGDTIPDVLVVAGGPGAGAVLSVIDSHGIRGIQVGPDDYRAGIVALNGISLAGKRAQDVTVILDGGNGPVLVAAYVATGAADASLLLPPGYDTFAPAESGVWVDGVPTVGVQVGDDALSTKLFGLDGAEHHLPEPISVG